MTAPHASVILLNWNGRAHLAECLPALVADGLPNADAEVLVVDNGSTDGSEELVRSFAGVRFVPTGRNLGFAAGNRVGAEASRGDVLAFLNNDTRPERGWLSALLGALTRDTVAVSGRMTSWDGAKVDFRNSAVTFDGHAFALDVGRPLADVKDVPGEERLLACGGNMAIRKSDFLAAGGFDDDFFAYLEDVDLSLRLRARGGTIRYEPRASVAHRGGATGTSLGLYNRGFLIEKNAFAVFWKNFDEELSRALLPAVLLTLVHRTERIARERGIGGATLLVHPYLDAPPPEVPKGLRVALVERVARLLGVSSPASSPFSADPHTLSQLRAIHRIAVDLPRLEAARRANLAAAKVPGRELFGRWPLLLVPTYPGDEELFASEPFRRLLPGELPLRRKALSEILFG